MNKMNLLIAASAVVVFAGCTHTEKKPDTPPPTVAQQAAANMASDRTDFVNRTQTRITEMTAFANQLRAKADTAAKPQKKKLSNAADDMDSSLKDVDKSLTEVKQADPANWLDYKRDVTKAMQSAETQYQNSVRLLQ